MKTDSISSFFSISQSATVKTCLVAGVAIGLSIASASAATQIVAVENFYSGVAATVAGGDASVTSMMSNPNQDPHEFQTDAATAKAVAEADIMIALFSRRLLFASIQPDLARARGLSLTLPST